jgi:hypothetical protein
VWSGRRQAGGPTPAALCSASSGDCDGAHSLAACAAVPRAASPSHNAPVTSHVMWQPRQHHMLHRSRRGSAVTDVRAFATAPLQASLAGGPAHEPWPVVTRPDVAARLRVVTAERLAELHAEHSRQQTHAAQLATSASPLPTRAPQGDTCSRSVQRAAAHYVGSAHAAAHEAPCHRTTAQDSKADRRAGVPGARFQAAPELHSAESGSLLEADALKDSALWFQLQWAWSWLVPAAHRTPPHVRNTARRQGSSCGVVQGSSCGVAAPASVSLPVHAAPPAALAATAARGFAAGDARSGSQRAQPSAAEALEGAKDFRSLEVRCMTHYNVHSGRALCFAAHSMGLIALVLRAARDVLCP